MVAVGAHTFGGVEVAPAGEDGQPFEHALLVFEEQLVAPVDDSAECLLAGQGSARSTGQQAEPVVEPSGDLCDRERSGASRRQFDRQRQPVELGADVGDDLVVVAGAVDSPTRRLSAGQEETDGVVGCQRRYRPDGFASDAQPLAARGEDAQPRASTQQVFGHLSGSGDDVLAVVEHDQPVLLTDQLGEPVRVRQVERRRDRRGNAGRVADRSQLDQVPAEAQAFGLGPPDLERQPGLAHSSGADEGDEAMVAEQGPEVAHLRVTANERCQRLGDTRGADGGDRTGHRFRHAGWGQCGVVGEDRRLQSAQLRPRIEAEFLAQELTALLEDPQGVGLPSAAVEREHQQPSHALTKGMGGDQFLELNDGPMVTPELQLEIKPVLGHRKSQLGQPGDRSRGEFVVGEVGKRSASPDRIRLGQQFGGRSERAGDSQRPPFRSPLLEPADVDVVPCQLQRVTVASHDYEVGRPQRTSELRRQPLQTVTHRRRRMVAPQRLDQVLRRDHPAHVQGQDRQQRPQLRTHHDHHVPVAVNHLEFTRATRCA